MALLKAGVIGCGGIATEKHLPSLRAVGGVSVAAFCDLVPARAEAAAKNFGAPGAEVFTDYRRLLQQPLDLVYVCTPNRWHAEMTVAALESGKNVMCEKPMAITFAEAEAMTAAARRAGKLLTIGYQNRYRADSRYLKSECAAGALGDIYYAKAKAIRRRMVPTWGVFLNETEQGGGPLIDIGTHALDLTLWMMDNYAPKSAVGTLYHKLNNTDEQANGFGPWNPADFTVEDSAFGFVVMENGATVTIEASWALNTLDVHEAVTVLCGTKAGADMHGGLTVNGARHNRLYITKPTLETGAVDYFRGADEAPEIAEQRVFLAAVRGEGELTVLPEQAAAVTRILEGVYRSAREGRQVFFDEA